MRRWLAVFLAVLLTAFAAPLEAQEAAAKDTPRDKEAELLDRADEIAKEVAKLRGLAIKRPIKRGVMNKAQLKERLIERVDQEYTPAEIRGEALAAKRLGLLPADADYLQTVLDLLTDQIAGFYDPWEKQLYLASWQSFGGDMLMAHEIDHALQDQHFDLAKFMKANKNNADATVARQALVEGDGTALMIEYSTRELGTTPWGNDAMIEQMGKGMTGAMAGMSDVPLALRESLIFPYLGGLRFVAHIRKHHPWTKVDAVFAKPPLSTEHILHPEKYESYEKPVRITARTPALLAGYEVVSDNVSGEKGLELFLRQHGVDLEKAEIAAAGWGGDRTAVYAPEGHGEGIAGVVGLVYTVWDAEADAIEFFESLSFALPKLAGGPGRKRSDGVIEHRLARGGAVTAQRKGDAVVLVIGAPPARSDDLLKSTWTWKVAR